MKQLFSALLFLAMAAWGISWPLSKIMTGYLSPLELASTRFLLAAIAFLPIIFILKLSFKIPLHAIKGVSLAILFNALFAVVFFYGLSLGNAGSAGVITTTLAPIFSNFIGSIIYKTKLHKTEKIGLLIGVIGGMFLVGNLGGLTNPYNLIFLCAALLWCFVTLSTKLVAGSLNMLMLNFYSSLFIGLIFLPCFFLDSGLFGKNGAGIESLDSVFIICAITISIVSTTFGTSLFYKGIEVLGFNKGGSFTLLVPSFALIFSWIILGETPLWNTLIGGTLAVLAIYLINFYRAHKR